MLTPLDIQKKEFRHSLRGYNSEEVDSFLDRVTQDYEILNKENLDLKERLDQAEQNMARYREIEEVLKKTMILAQKNADELRQNTEKESQLTLDRARIEAEQLNREAEQEAVAIIEKAERQAAAMISEAEEKVSQIIEEHSRLERQAQVFRMQFRALLEAQARFLDSEEESQIKEVRLDALDESTEDGDNVLASA
ncbi:MAG: Septum site-determining protein DivIVA [Pelotomaculum sp. PtaB.Bin013]|uniref:DivIVA domain-containing protein n=1 Tax=Pelotomaculum isophthalicicum JI TaxID=947010 RepID=A0A9X4JVQ3_9FIRM|nr:DivIVA domain-containing protein [Pelotomaculum isophthalicicum]MDF9408771.1 DivIVA domain-containing protein [Pelotomaculum isophthalicicum JI]OPX91902.1 MAG: Septum site-determining protein DivIVA [Pelotomaculum sp. PtaB.Bin013]